MTEDQIKAILTIDNYGKGDRVGAYLALWKLAGDPEALQP